MGVERDARRLDHGRQLFPSRPDNILSIEHRMNKGHAPERARESLNATDRGGCSDGRLT